MPTSSLTTPGNPPKVTWQPTTKTFPARCSSSVSVILSKGIPSTEVPLYPTPPPALTLWTILTYFPTGLRPFGVSFIYAGYDSQREFQLYQSNPSGNYGGWKATSVGANNASAQSLLKQDYKEDCDLTEACAIAVKILSKTMDSTTLSSEKSTYPLL